MIRRRPLGARRPPRSGAGDGGRLGHLKGERLPAYKGAACKRLWLGRHYADWCDSPPAGWRLARTTTRGSLRDAGRHAALVIGKREKEELGERRLSQRGESLL